MEESNHNSTVKGVWYIVIFGLFVPVGVTLIYIALQYWREILLYGGGGLFLIVTSLLGFLLANIIPILLLLILLVLLAR